MSITIFAVLAMVSGCWASQQYVVRTNMGVVFHRVASSNLAKGGWHVTFAKPFLKMPPFNNRLMGNRCEATFGENDESKHICNEVFDMLDGLEYKKLDAIAKIDNNMGTVKGLIPVSLSSNSDPVKRSLLPFLGKAASFLFGVVDEESFNKLKSGVAALKGAQALNSGQIKRISNQLASFMNSTDARFENNFKAISDNHNNIAKLWNKVSDLNKRINSITTLTTILLTLVKNVVLFTESLVDMEMQSQRWLNGVQTLLKGYLAHEIVSSDHLETTLSHVRSNLESSMPGYHLVHSEIAYYYQIRDITFTKDDHNLYVTITLPISASVGYVDIYAISVVLLPVSPDNKLTQFYLNLWPTWLSCSEP